MALTSCILCNSVKFSPIYITTLSLSNFNCDTHRDYLMWKKSHMTCVTHLPLSWYLLHPTRNNNNKTTTRTLGIVKPANGKKAWPCLNSFIIHPSGCFVSISMNSLNSDLVIFFKSPDLSWRTQKCHWSSEIACFLNLELKDDVSFYAEHWSGSVHESIILYF